jgi:hypothetical protein
MPRHHERTDGIFRNGGDQLLLNVAEGQWRRRVDIGLDLSDAAVDGPTDSASMVAAGCGLCGVAAACGPA